MIGRRGEILVVSPHCDDAVLSLGTVLARARRPVRVLTLFDRSRATIDGTPPGQVTALRHAEDARVAAAFGHRFDYAGLPDSSVRGVAWDDARAPLDRALLARAARWLSLRLGDSGGAACLYLPAAVGMHPDHRLALLAALDALGRSRRRVMLYAEHPYLLLSAHDHRLRCLMAGRRAVRQRIRPAATAAMLAFYPSQLSPERRAFLCNSITYEVVWELKPRDAHRIARLDRSAPLRRPAASAVRRNGKV
ncbi:hypothetical protein VY88_23050 [Azospirillum thiophilum]|uniref:GlcNAc-PI de-N-acetylase n=1 Tax=Azospirillum thiophilum TaxID=528244 RepID=A0AAC8W2C0_9PROT|nr:PIG-L family deacetylase [Azospirillum thiophilum]ALG73681.1 hypothetical protein AL072_22220 [Azospirillum thiophilum]KJR63067.1 hypothetical protein VY88_23050 [Azospirillum thiophilum]